MSLLASSPSLSPSSSAFFNDVGDHVMVHVVVSQPAFNSSVVVVITPAEAVLIFNGRAQGESKSESVVSSGQLGGGGRGEAMEGYIVPTGI